jgi:hypothetical protein
MLLLFSFGGLIGEYNSFTRWPARPPDEFTLTVEGSSS